MVTFEDNAVVTAGDLNNIAIDLGHTTFSLFSDKSFGVDELNRITADLVGKGILTTGNRCEPKLNNGKVYIQSGVIVFGSGAKIRIESPIEVAAAMGDYIYAFNDVTTGKTSIIASADKPTTGDFVMLAQLDRAGSVVDMREKAVANITLSADLQNNYAEQTVVVDKEYKWSVQTGSEKESVAVIPELPQCRLLLLKSFCGGATSKVVELTDSYQYIYHDRWCLQVKKVDGILYFIGYTNPNGTPLRLSPGDSFTFLLA